MKKQLKKTDKKKQLKMNGQLIECFEIYEAPPKCYHFIDNLIFNDKLYKRFVKKRKNSIQIDFFVLEVKK